MGGTRLELRGVAKSFGTAPVLSGVNLTVEPGEFVALVGRSGCGKSTLLRLMAGLDAPTAGEVLCDGEPLRGLFRPARVMFQEARLLPWLRVGDNAALGLADREPAERMLAAVGLADRAGDWPAVLSSGQKQRVALARALAAVPPLLLLDEPLGSIDALTRVEMQRLIERLWRQSGGTAVLVTHDVEEAVALADRVLVLEGGRVAAEWRVGLPRPRDRSSAAFAGLAGEVLERLLGRPGV